MEYTRQQVARRRMRAALDRMSTSSAGTDMDDLERRVIAARAAGTDVVLTTEELDGVLLWMWSGVEAKADLAHEQRVRWWQVRRVLRYWWARHVTYRHWDKLVAS